MLDFSPTRSAVSIIVAIEGTAAGRGSQAF